MSETIYLTKEDFEFLYRLVTRRYYPDNEDHCVDDINQNNLNLLVREPKSRRGKKPLYPTIYNKAALYLTRILEPQTSPFPNYRNQMGISVLYGFFFKNGIDFAPKAHRYQEIVEAIEKDKKNILEISAMIEENSRRL